MAVTYIKTGILGGNLFDGWVESTDAYDHVASTNEYTRLFEKRLRAAFPGAALAIEVQHGASGSSPLTYVEVEESDNYAVRDNAELEIDRIGEALFEDYDAWLVEA